ncbi:MAG TPA: sugar-binding transcriptional regulator [Thermoanaerobacterales bacterium]|nr:sugar-binding transcriptional regulator [Thermoanaerobacterales bacterium]
MKNEWKEKRLLTKVAQMYYDENKTQQEIADKYGISRPSVSRLLQKAREKGIVEIKVHNEFSFTVLEKELEKKFNLREVIITPTDENESLKRLLAEAAAGYLTRVLKDHDIIGVSWGTTLAYISEYIKNETRDVVFVPLVGGVGQSRLDVHSNQIVLNLARAFNGKWQLLHVPAIVDSEEVRESLLSDTNISKSLEIASNSNVALIGIGAPLAPNSTILETGYYTDKILNDLEKAGAICDLCSIFIDVDGKVCDVELNQRVIGISIDHLKKIPIVVGVAGGVDKHEAILAALKGRYINVLVTDEKTGNYLLRSV